MCYLRSIQLKLIKVKMDITAMARRLPPHGGHTRKRKSASV